jgi:probable rRNA maturation factor
MKKKEKIDWQSESERLVRKLMAKSRRLGLVPVKMKLKASAQVNVTVVGSTVMTRLNRQFRGKNSPTDVLSFPAPEVFVDAGVIGELVICLPVLRRQARELGHSPEQELQVLLAHGLLHLLGYDHEVGARKSAIMRRAEVKLLSGVGLIDRH